jgi:2-dehydro-3-deoxyphosphogluconate aldolase/(4S)-4-hydroxy-2-oxoglutarate aldolase
MTAPRDPIATIERSRLLVIVRLEDPSEELARALLDAGVEVAELSLAAPGAAEAIARWRASFPELVVGAGTVLDAADCESALAAGAEFLVAPGFSREVSDRARGAGVPHVPGALTPSEIQACLAAGSTLVKLFPAMPLGHRYMSALLGPLPHLRLLATGGIDESNAGAFLAAGAAAVAVGSAVVRSGSTYGSVLEAARRILDATTVSEEEHEYAG